MGGFFQFIARSLGTLSSTHITWFTWFTSCTLIGKDFRGNKYYQASPRPGYKYPRRWVVYNGVEEASAVPPEWHGWLHHQTNDVPNMNASPYRKPWQQPHQPNATGTTARYLPQGHVQAKSKHAKTYGDYQPWQPPQ